MCSSTLCMSRALTPMCCIMIPASLHVSALSCQVCMALIAKHCTVVMPFQPPVLA